jgi:hypothetical protein
MNPKRSIIIDMIATFIAKKCLSPARPIFNKMTDEELLHMIGWAQKWPIEQVYDTAFEQVFPEKQLPDSKTDFHVWFMVDNPKLPTIVREELIRAFRIHMVSGRMDVLRLGAAVAVWSKRIMWIGLFLLPVILYVF